MKKFLILAVALISVATVSCTSQNGATTTAANVDSTSNGVAYTGKIAFIRMDSLMNNYGMYIDLSDEFAKKSTSVQNELINKGRSLEIEGRQLEENYQKGAITRYQVESKAQELQKKQQDIVAYRDRKLSELQQEESEMGAKISNVVKAYLEEYNATKKYSMILQTVGGSPVLIADPALDITNEILEVLNARYKESLEKSKK